LAEVFNKIGDQRPIALAPGLLARAVDGERMTFAVVDLEPGSVSPRHQHVNEQVGLVIRGSMTLTVEDEERTLGPGDLYLIPSNASHTAVAGAEGASIVDVFSPPRADWEGFERREPSSPHWP
jgi:unsaturated pyranuronate lyase